MSHRGTTNKRRQPSTRRNAAVAERMLGQWDDEVWTLRQTARALEAECERIAAPPFTPNGRDIAWLRALRKQVEKIVNDLKRYT